MWMCQCLELHNFLNQYFPNDQCIVLQYYAWVEDPLEVQDKSTDFNITEYKKLIGVVLKFKLQPPFMKLSLVRFLCSISEEYPQLSEKVIKIFLFQTTYLYLCEARIFKIYCNKSYITIWKQKQIWESSLLSALSPNMKKILQICKTVLLFSPKNFWLGKYSSFPWKYVIYVTKYWAYCYFLNKINKQIF